MMCACAYACACVNFVCVSVYTYSRCNVVIADATVVNAMFPHRVCVSLRPVPLSFSMSL